MYTDNRQSLITITLVPALYERQGVAAVVANKRPEIHQHHTTAQTFYREWFRIDPCTRAKSGSCRRVRFRCQAVRRDALTSASSQSGDAGIEQTKRLAALCVICSHHQRGDKNKQSCCNNILSVHCL